MSLFNDNLKNIGIKSIAVLIIASFLVLFLLNRFGFPFNQSWISVVIVIYFIFKLWDYRDSFIYDLKNMFSKIKLKYIVFIVFLNIFFSYGMLYFSNFIVTSFPSLDFLISFALSSRSVMGYLPFVGGFLSTVILSSISEELVFRGVLISRLRLIVPTVFAIIISSLLFGALHSFGSIFSAFVFAVCMAILYLKTDNICVPIFAHFLNNLIAETIRLVDVNEVLFTNGNVIFAVSAFAVISAIILFVSILKELNNVK